MSKFYKIREEAVGQQHKLGDYDDDFESIPAFLDAFKKRLEINILSNQEDELQFEIVGIDASIANALRRIMISEVPTMAIEKILIENNTSIVQDDVLAHRLGLIPIKVDPTLFEDAGEVLSEANSIEFKLEVSCQRSSHESVYSGDLQWVPLGEQYETLKDNAPQPVHSDILIAKMKSGQEISLRAICTKGIGKEHAKWSPVCTASYRIMPVISLEKEFKDEEAQELVDSCPMGVFDIEDLGSHKKAVVGNAKRCTMCRECIRDPKRQGKVNLLRKGDHFLFTVESVGILKPQTIVKNAIDVLRNKSKELQAAMENGSTVAILGATN